MIPQALEPSKHMAASAGCNGSLAEDAGSRRRRKTMPDEVNPGQVRKPQKEASHCQKRKEIEFKGNSKRDDL